MTNIIFWRKYLKKGYLKSILIENSLNSLNKKFEILKTINHEFIVCLYYAFDKNEKINFIMEYISGGSLSYHMKNNKFTEKQAKFIICCIIIGLDVLHKNDYIHNNLNPSNLIFEENGYLKLTGFGFSEKWKFKNKNNIEGSLSYMAPELICKKNHTYCSDFYSLGIILYEIIHGFKPYEGNSVYEVKEKILSNRIKVNSQIEWSKESIDFCNKLLKRNISKRLGNFGVLEIKNHPWLNNIDWKNLTNKTLKAPFTPSISNNIEKKLKLKGLNSMNKPSKLKLDRNSKKLLKSMKFNYKKENYDNISIETKSS